MRSVLSEVMILIHDHLVTQFGNIQENNNNWNFLSQFKHILLGLISDAFENFLRLLHLINDNCPAIDRGNRVGDKYSLIPEACLFVAVLSHLFSSNLLRNNNPEYAALLYRCPINFDAVLLHPYRLRKPFKFDQINEILTNLELEWDEIGLANAVEELYCNSRAWPNIYSYMHTWKLVYPHALFALERRQKHKFLAVLNSRVPEDLAVFSIKDMDYVVADTKVLVNALVKSSSTSNFESSRQIHGLIKSIICHRCCCEIRLNIIKKLIHFYFDHETCGSILPLFLDLFRPMCSMRDCSIEDIAPVLEPFIDEMNGTSLLGDDQLMEMHEIYLSVLALMLILVRRYGSDGSSFISNAIKAMRSFHRYVDSKIMQWEKVKTSDAPENWFRLYLVMDALQLLLSNLHQQN
mmetsp:Transcript_26411/g.40888  ORF Transcript_26411/g.40888 Transcript_26411/m.40888 type:complete len:407 (+) Transcript_26411:577-1797(+)